jgi:hypothetical protein
MSAAASAPALPLFFHRIVGVDPMLHGDLRLDRTRGFAFAAGVDFVPLGLGEMEAAAQHYPILFTIGAEPMPVALLGLRKGQNLFVMPDGAWRPECYVPAYCRAFPFVFVRTESSEATYVAMEADAACVRRDTGEPLFADGRPTVVLEQSIALCDGYRANAVAAGQFAQALADQGLLDPETATINLDAGGSLRVDGFQVLNHERLGNVADDVFLDWRRHGWIPCIYAHVHSMGRWGRLIDLAAAANQDDLFGPVPARQRRVRRRAGPS